jgi:hypothetical protein
MLAFVERFNLTVQAIRLEIHRQGPNRMSHETYRMDDC